MSINGAAGSECKIWDFKSWIAGDEVKEELETQGGGTVTLASRSGHVCQGRRRITAAGSRSAGHGRREAHEAILDHEQSPNLIPGDIR